MATKSDPSSNSGTGENCSLELTPYDLPDNQSENQILFDVINNELTK